MDIARKNTYGAGVVVALTLTLVCSFGAALADENSSSSQSSSAGSAVPANLDLSSTAQLVTATSSGTIQTGGSIGTNGLVTGGSVTQINQGQSITYAQNIALIQATTGAQMLLVDPTGGASGGMANLSSGGVPSLAQLVVPQGVQLNLIDFNATSPLNVSGNVSILGSVYALQTTPNVAAVLNSANLTLGSGAMLSGYLPSAAGLPQNLFASAGLNLNVINNIVNQGGTITAPGSINLNVGGTVTNQSLGNITATISASQNLNMVLGQGTLFNSGLLSAMNAINLQTRDSITDLVIENTGGTLQAIGDINIRDQLFKGTGALSILGGDLISTQLNINSGYGDSHIDVGNISGLVNMTGNWAGISTSGGTLQLGAITLLADPIFANNAGSININNDIDTGGGDLAIVARDNVTTSANQSITTHGGKLFIIAGVNFAYAGTNNANTGSINGGAGDSGAITLTITGRSNGGDIDLSNSNRDYLTTNATGDGGDITIVAYRNITGGQVKLDPGRALTTFGAAGFKSGNVTIVSESISGTGISTGEIGTTGAGTIGGGNVQLLAGAAADPSGITLTQVAAAPETITQAGGSFLPVSYNDAAITCNDGVNAAGAVTIRTAAGVITTSGITGTNINITNTAGGMVLGSITGGGTGTSIAINAGAGVIQMNSGGATVIRNTSATGAGGAVSITGGAFTSPLAGDIDVSSTGGNGAGGSIAIDCSGDFFLSAADVALNASGNGNGSGGNISLIAANISLDGGNPGKMTSIAANGGGSGGGGVIQVVSNSAKQFQQGTNLATLAGDNASKYAFMANAGSGGNNAGGKLTLVNFGTGGVYHNVALPPVLPNGLRGGLQAYSSGNGNGGSIGVYAPLGPVKLGESFLGLRKLAIVASTNIDSDSDAASVGYILDLSRTNNAGGDLLMVAGAKSVYNPVVGTLTISGGSITGGSVLLGDTLDGLSRIRTDSSAAGQKGGNVAIVAFAGTAGSAGAVNLGGGNVGPWTLTAGGTGAGANGDVLLIGGGSPGSGKAVSQVTATSMSIDSSTGNGPGGNITLAAATPTITGAPDMVLTDAGISNGASFAPGAVQAFTLTTAPINGSGNVLLTTASNLTSNATITGANVTINANTFTINGQITATAVVGLISLTANGNIANGDFFSGNPNLFSGPNFVFSMRSITGNIGTPGTPINLNNFANVSNVTANAPTAGKLVNMSDTGITNLVGASSAGGLFRLAGSTPLVVLAGASVNATDINLTTSAGGTLTVSGTLTASNSITLSAAGGAGVLTVSTALSSPTLTATAGTGGISINGTGSTNASTITVNSGGAVDIVDTNAGLITLIGGSGNPFTLNATDASSGILGTGALAAQTLSLTAGTAGININSGSSVNAATLNLSSTGMVNVVDTRNAIITLNASKGSTFTLNGTGLASSLNLAGNIDSPVVDLRAGTAGISGAGTLNATTLALNSTGAITIIDTAAGVIQLNNSGSGVSFNLTANNAASGIAGNGTLNSPALTLNAGTAGISYTGANTINAGSMTINSGGDATFVNNLAPTVSVNASKVGGGKNFSLSVSAGTLDVAGDIAASAGTANNISLTSSGDLTNTGGALTANTIDLTSTAGSVILSNAVNGAGAPGRVNVVSANTISSASIGSNIFANEVILRSTGGDVALTALLTAGSKVTLIANPLGAGKVSTTAAINAASLVVSAGTGGVTISGTGSTDAAFLTINSTGAVDIVDTSAAQIALTNATGTSFMLNATNAGSGIITNGALNASSINLNAGTQGIILSGANATTANSVVATSTGSVNIDDTATGVVSIAGSADPNAGTFQFRANSASSVATSGPVSGNTVTLTANNAGATFNLQHMLTGTSGGTINLSSDGSINPSNINGNLTSNSLNLTSVNGSIGGAASLSVTANNLMVNASKGAIDVTNNAAGTISLLSSQSATTLIVNAPGADISIANGVTVQGGSGVVINGSSAKSLTVATGGTLSGQTLDIKIGSLTADGSLSSTVGKLSISSTAGLTVGGTATITSAGQADLTASAGTLQINAALNATGSANLTAAGNTVGITSGVVANSVTIDASTVTNSGTVNGNAGTLTFANSNGGLLNISTSGAMSAATVSAATAGPVTVQISATGSISGTTINLSPTAGDLSLTNDNSLSATGQLTLSATGGAVTISNNSNVSGATVSVSGQNAVSVTTGGSLTSTGILNIGSTTAGTTLNNTGTMSGTSMQVNGQTAVSFTNGNSFTSTGAVTIGSTAADVTLNNTGTMSGSSMQVNGQTAVSFTNGNSFTSTGAVTIGSTAAGVTVNNTGTTSGATVSVNGQGVVDVTNGNTLSATGALTLNSTGNTLMLNNSGTMSAGPLQMTSVGAMTVTNSNGISSTAALTLGSTGGALTITNTGTMSGNSTGLTALNDLNVSGATSTLAGTTGINAMSTNGLVGIQQNTITGTVSGSAGTSYSVTADNSSLTAGNISTAGGNLNLTATAARVSLVNGSNLTAANTPGNSSNLSITGNTGGALAAVDTGTGSVLTAGTMQGANNRTSTVISDYDISGIANSGAVNLTATNGSVNVGAGSQLFSTGGDITVASLAGTDLGAGSQMFAQAGNLIVNAFTTLNSGGGTLTSVARTTGGTQVIGGQTVPTFQGGAIGLYSGLYTPAQTALITADLNLATQSRLPGGYFNPAAGPGSVNTAGSTFNYTTGAGYIALNAKPGGSIVITNSTINASGVLLVDPPTALTLNNLIINIFQPALAPTPPTPPVVPAAAAAAAVVPAAAIPSLGFLVATDLASSTNTAQQNTVTRRDAIRFDVELGAAVPLTHTRCTQPIMFAGTSGDDAYHVSGGCQLFYLGEASNGPVAIGREGTTLSSAGKNHIRLEEGQAFVITDKTAVTVDTPGGPIVIPSESAAMVTSSATGVVRVANLSGSSINFQSARGREEANEGEELVITAAEGCLEEEMIPTDGVERVALTTLTKNVSKNRFNREQMMKTAPMVTCPGGCFSGPTERRLRNLQQKVGFNFLPDRTQLKSSIDDTVLRPVAYAMPVVSKGTINPLLVRTLIRQSASTESSVHDTDILSLDKGEMVLSPRNDILVRCGLASVHVHRNATVSLIRSDNVLKVRHLCGSAPVTIVGGLKSFAQVQPGQEVILAADSRALKDAVRNETVSRRRTVMAKLDNNTYGMISDFSVMSFLQASEVLNVMAKSKQKDDRSTMSNILKMAACLSIVTSKYGPFSLGSGTRDK